MYQMGKVGSSTIRKSINAANIEVYPYHLHYMSGIDYMVGLCRKQSLPLMDHILSSIYCKKLIKKEVAKGKKFKVITLVRDPIAKNISQFFQNVEISYPEFRYAEKEKSLSEYELLSELTGFYIKNFRHKDPLVWFDVEMKQFTNIDVFQFNFPHEKGYQIYENKSFRILLMRLENLNTCISDAMDRFLGIKNFRLVNDNISKEKNYAGLYEQMKNRIKLPESYIEEMYASKMATHFYTESEIRTFKQRWRRDS